MDGVATSSLRLNDAPTRESGLQRLPALALTNEKAAGQPGQHFVPSGFAPATSRRLCVFTLRSTTSFGNYCLAVPCQLLRH